MSWSFTAIGKPAAIAAKAMEDFSQYKCSEPEESLRQNVLSILQLSLASMPKSIAVQVKASGSQYNTNQNEPVNSLNLEIQPIYGFVE